MTTIDLRNLTPEARNARVNEAVAVHCAGYILYPGKGEPPMSRLEVPEKWCYRDREGRFYLGEPYETGMAKMQYGLTFGYMWVRPKFAEAADAVLPLLEKHEWQVTRFNGGRPETPQYWINLPMGHPDGAEGEAETLPLAACICLLRHAGIEVTT